MDRPDINKAIKARFGRPQRNRRQQREHAREVLNPKPQPAGYVKNEAARKAAKRAAKSRRKNRA